MFHGDIGKTAEEVADEIIAALDRAAKEGCVLVLQGLSGTGETEPALPPLSRASTLQHSQGAALSVFLFSNF